MSAPTVTVNAAHLYDIARHNGVDIEFAADRGYCTVSGTTFVAVLPAVERVR